MQTKFDTRLHHVINNCVQEGNSANQQDHSTSPSSPPPSQCVALRPVFGPWPPRSPSSSLPSRLLPPSTPASTANLRLQNSTLSSTSGLSHVPSSSGTLLLFGEGGGYENQPSLLRHLPAVLYSGLKILKASHL